MNLGTTCILDHQEMCCPHTLYVVHFTERLTLEQAQEKMSKLTGFNLREGEYHSVELHYVDNTKLYHLIQLGEETGEVKKARDTLRRYRPQILESTLKGCHSSALYIKLYNVDAINYLDQCKFYDEIEELIDQNYKKIIARSRANRAAKAAEKAAREAVESQTKLNNIIK